MSSARLVRSTKSRFFLYVCSVLGFAFLVYLFHGSQLQLDDNRKALAACKLQTESLSAQLQVIFEYKLRLEKSLQKEKTDHKRTKDECQDKAKQDKEECERELVESANKYSALQQSNGLLQSKQKDLEDEIAQLRKKNLQLLEEMDIQRKQSNASLLEEQQLRKSKEKVIEIVKTKNLELEVELKRVRENYELLKKDKVPESSNVAALEKTNIQLERELQAVKKKLESCLSGDKQLVETKASSQGGVGDNPSGIEPPKELFVNKMSSNSTTPQINPEAVIDHDGSSQKPSLTKSTAANKDLEKRPTQAGAAPLEIPMKQQENSIEMEMNRQIPIPNNLESHQSPENTVIRRPDFSDRVDEGKKSHVDENQGGEVGQNIAGPMNPIQEPAVPPPQVAAPHGKEININRPLAYQLDEEAPQNGAHEEGEDDPAPGRGNWIIGDNDNKVLPRHMDEQGELEYQEKDNQEEEEDEEGEQMDYHGEAAPKLSKPLPKLHQFESNRRVAGGGIMLNPK